MKRCFCFFVAFVAISCHKIYGQPLKVEGFTMGTTWSVTYFDAQQRDLKTKIDSVLSRVNKSINYFDPGSEVSQFNNSDSALVINHKSFLPIAVAHADAVSRKTGGAFDITVLPLTNAWGFGPKKPASKPSARDIDSIRTFVGHELISLYERQHGEDILYKSDPRVQLDLGGIGQGLGADIIASYLVGLGVENFLVELGGEGRSRGTHVIENRPWKIAVLHPNSTIDDQFFHSFVNLRDCAFSTSGNFFNYKIIDGRKFGHTLDPRTGFPVTNEVLSVTVITELCSNADAWATAFMVLGLDKSVELLSRESNLDAIILYSVPGGEVQTYVTPRLKHAVTFADDRE
jgi:FAD:protein FMN transferase